MWSDAIACARTWFSVVIEDASWIGLVSEGVRVKVVRDECLGRPFVAVIADALLMAELDALGPIDLLELNHALAVGAFEREDDRLLLRASLPMTGLDPIDLRRTILHLARQAAHLQRLARKGPTRPVLEHLAY